MKSRPVRKATIISIGVILLAALFINYGTKINLFRNNDRITLQEKVLSDEEQIIKLVESNVDEDIFSITVSNLIDNSADVEWTQKSKSTKELNNINEVKIQTVKIKAKKINGRWDLY